MLLDPRKAFRAVVRTVHPDLFAAYPFERAQNSESLKRLNGYVDELRRSARVQPSAVDFWVIEDGRLTNITAVLPIYGSLGPLFHAFGLISTEELQAGAGTYADGSQDATNLLEWLSALVQDALRASQQHDTLKRVVRELRASLEDRFALAAIQVGGEFAVSAAEQRRQIQALRTLGSCLAALAADDPRLFEGVNIRLYHPDSAPFDTASSPDTGGDHLLRMRCIESYVADDGCLHIVADRHSIQGAVSRLDLPRARLLTRLSLFWFQRVRDLSPLLVRLLGCENVWCDSRSEESSQRFVLWAGCILERRAEFERVLGGRRFAFSMLVHADASSPMVDFLAASSVLQVRSDCSPQRLLEFLAGEAGLAANEAAEVVASSRAQEDALLEQVREELGCRRVICVCSSHDGAKVVAAAQRLLANAGAITAMVDLTGASIAIDDCYELWESGFISIPHDFQLSDLRPKLRRLLTAEGWDSNGSNGSAGSSSRFSSSAPSICDSSHDGGIGALHLEDDVLRPLPTVSGHDSSSFESELGGGSEMYSSSTAYMATPAPSGVPDGLSFASRTVHAYPGSSFVAFKGHAAPKRRFGLQTRLPLLRQQRVCLQQAAPYGPVYYLL